MARLGGVVVLICLSLFMTAALADQSGAVVTPLEATSPAATQQLIKMTISLAIVVVTIFAVAWLVQRYSRLPAVGQGQLSVVGSLAVGPKERVVLLQVGQEQVLVGVTPSEISRLHVLPEAIDLNPVSPDGQGPSFAQRLQATLKGQRHEG